MTCTHAKETSDFAAHILNRCMDMGRGMGVAFGPREWRFLAECGACAMERVIAMPLAELRALANAEIQGKGAAEQVH